MTDSTARRRGHGEDAIYELRPVITTGAEVMDRILNASGRQNRS